MLLPTDILAICLLLSVVIYMIVIFSLSIRDLEKEKTALKLELDAFKQKPAAK